MESQKQGKIVNNYPPLECFYFEVGMCTTPMVIMKEYCKNCKEKKV